MNKKQDSGIVINNELRIKTLIMDDLPMYVRLIQIILIFLAVISPVLMFVNAIEIKIDLYVVVPIVLLVIIMEYIAFRIIKIKDNSLFAMILVLLFSISIVATGKKLMLGIFCFVEKYLLYFNMKFNTDYILNTKIRDNSDKNILLIVMAVIIFLSLIISYLIIVKMNKGLYIIVTLIWPILCYFVDLKPDYLFFTVYIIVTIVILGIEQMVKKYEIDDQDRNFVRIQRIFKDIAYAKIELTVAIMAICLFFLFSIVFSKKEYEQNNYIKNISSAMRAGVENLINKKTKILDAFDREVGSNGLDGLTDMLNATPVLSNGRINEGGNARYYNKRIFRLVSNEVNDTLYLKHFIGLEYENGWISKTKDKNKLLELSKCDNMLGEVLDSNVDKLSDVLYYDMVGILTKELRSNLVPIGANRKHEIGEEGVVKYSEDNISVVAGYEAEIQKIYNGIEDIQTNYNNYDEKAMHKLYLEVPKRLKKTVDKVRPEIDEYAEKIKQKDKISNSDLDQQKLIIRALVNYMNYNFEYTLKPGKVPEDMDPVEYFLLENKKGYCMYYAAAATAILRSYGIPTRYVEGYVVRTKDCENARRVKSDEYVKKLGSYNTSTYDFKNVPLYEYNIKDTNGHAWVEVFIEKLGWVTVEVTPTSWGQNEEKPPVEKKDELETVHKPSEDLNNQYKTEDKNVTNNVENDTTNNNISKDKSIDKKDDKDKKKDNIVIVIIILLTIVGIYLCIKGRKNNDIVDKQKQLKTKNKLEYACKMSMYILKEYGIEFSCGKSYKDFAKIIYERYEDDTIKNVESILQSILKSQYSNVKLNEHEEKNIYEFYNFLVCKYTEEHKGIARIRKCSIDNYIRKV